MYHVKRNGSTMGKSSSQLGQSAKTELKGRKKSSTLLRYMTPVITAGHHVMTFDDNKNDISEIYLDDWEEAEVLPAPELLISKIKDKSVIASDVKSTSCKYILFDVERRIEESVQPHNNYRFVDADIKNRPGRILRRKFCDNPFSDVDCSEERAALASLTKEQESKFDSLFTNLDGNRNEKEVSENVDRVFPLSHDGSVLVPDPGNYTLATAKSVTVRDPIPVERLPYPSKTIPIEESQILESATTAPYEPKFTLVIPPSEFLERSKEVRIHRKDMPANYPLLAAYMKSTLEEPATVRKWLLNGCDPNYLKVEYPSIKSIAQFNVFLNGEDNNNFKMQSWDYGAEIACTASAEDFSHELSRLPWSFRKAFASTAGISKIQAEIQEKGIDAVSAASKKSLTKEMAEFEKTVDSKFCENLADKLKVFMDMNSKVTLRACPQKTVGRIDTLDKRSLFLGPKGFRLENCDPK